MSQTQQQTEDQHRAGTSTELNGGEKRPDTRDFSTCNKIWVPLGVFPCLAATVISAGSNNRGRVIGRSTKDLMCPFTQKTKARSQRALMFVSPRWWRELAIIAFRADSPLRPLRKAYFYFYEICLFFSFGRSLLWSLPVKSLTAGVGGCGSNPS